MEYKSGELLRVKKKQTFSLFPSDKILMINPTSNISTVAIQLNVSNESLEPFNKVKSDYELSNRHKLYQAIKKSTVTGQDLSIAMGKNKHYLSSTASQSRFNSRGDISETQLNRLITDIAFAEREVLGLGAKEVDKIKNQKIIDSINDTKVMVDLIGSGNTDIIRNPLFKDGGLTDLGEQTRNKIKLAQDSVNLKKGAELKTKTITIQRYYLYIFAVLLILGISLSIYTLTKLA